MNESAFSLRLCEVSGTSVLLDETDGTGPLEGFLFAPDACALFDLTSFAVLLPNPLAPLTFAACTVPLGPWVRVGDWGEALKGETSEEGGSGN